MRELRCEGNVLHCLVDDEGDVKPSGIIEFRCKSKFCGKSDGTIVLHRFDLGTGASETHRYSEPPIHQERGAL